MYKIWKRWPSWNYKKQLCPWEDSLDIPPPPSNSYHPRSSLPTESPVQLVDLSSIKIPTEIEDAEVELVPWLSAKQAAISPQTNSSPLKMDGWKTSFRLRRPIFRGYVSFREGKSGDN